MLGDNVTDLVLVVHEQHRPMLGYWLSSFRLGGCIGTRGRSSRQVDFSRCPFPKPTADSSSSSGLARQPIYLAQPETGASPDLDTMFAQSPPKHLRHPAHGGIQVGRLGRKNLLPGES